MKKTSFVLTLLLSAFLSALPAGWNCAAQSRSVKDVRITYLWDVTLSMKGYNGAPDIYDDVVKALVKDISAISDERTEIVVIPFQDSEYCDVWRVRATEEGKRQITSRITAYDNGNVTNTSISRPLRYAIDNVFSPDKVDIMKLLTDGRDNVAPKEVGRLLDNWCSIAEQKDVYGYYVMLTPAAKDDEIVLKLEKVCRFEAVEGMGFQDIVSVFPPEKLSVNVRDDYGKPLQISFTTGNSMRIPEGFRVRVRSVGGGADGYPYITVDETATVTDNAVTVTPEFLKSMEEMKELLPKEGFETLLLEITPAEGMEAGEYALTRIPDKTCRVELVNKPEKSLRIHVR